MVEIPASLRVALHVLASGPISDGRAFRSALDCVVSDAMDDKRYLTTFNGLQYDYPDQEMAMLLLVRSVWRLIPRNLLTAPEGSTRKLAIGMLKKTDVAPDDKDIASLTAILNRMKRYLSEGRGRSRSFNLSDNRQAEIFQEQLCRCAACGYQFNEGDLNQLTANMSDWENHADPVGPNDVVPENMYGTPVLDHVVPLALGPDKPSNWQILCWTCNSGKSDILSTFLPERNMIKGVRDRLRLTVAMRYQVIARADHCCRCGKPRKHATNMRVRILDTDRLFTRDNLAMHCESCALS